MGDKVLLNSMEYNLDFLQETNHSLPIKVVVAGHVDDGKSTLIGRLLHETGSLLDSKIEEMREISKNRGVSFEWSFVLDSFQIERDQSITLDTTRARFKTPAGKDIIIIDVPGHVEFLKNMISGTSNADLAFLIIDVTKGIREQTRRHLYLLKFLGIQKIGVLINKMDLVNYSKDAFEKIQEEIKLVLSAFGVDPVCIIPISASHGINIKQPCSELSWYQGPSVLEFLDKNESTSTLKLDVNLRFSVQDIYRFDSKRIIVGKIESGVLKIGDQILVSPSKKIAYIQSIESWHTLPKKTAYSGESIGICLDSDLFVERGDIISHIYSAPNIQKSVRATIFWFGQDNLSVGDSLSIRILTFEAVIQIDSINFKFDGNSEKQIKGDYLEQNQFSEIEFSSDIPFMVDNYKSTPATSRFVLSKNNEMVAFGTFLDYKYSDKNETKT